MRYHSPVLDICCCTEWYIAPASEHFVDALWLELGSSHGIQLFFHSSFTTIRLSHILELSDY